MAKESGLISSVTVDMEGTEYACEPVDFGYLCGWCSNPLPKMPPTVGDECPCGAHVASVRRVDSRAKNG